MTISIVGTNNRTNTYALFESSSNLSRIFSVRSGLVIMDTATIPNFHIGIKIHDRCQTSHEPRKNRLLELIPGYM